MNLDACATARDKVLTVHSVRTAKIVLDMLVDANIFGSECKVVLHWFTGGPKEAQRANELGCYFSVNATMLAQPRHQEVLMKVPLDRLLTESDGPFSQTAACPETPDSMCRVVEGLARVRGLSTAEIQGAVVANFEDMLYA